MEDIMPEKNVLDDIRHELQEYEGRKVSVKAKRARRGFTVSHGILYATYPSVFTIATDDEIHNKLSFSYSEILTKTVILEWE